MPPAPCRPEDPLVHSQTRSQYAVQAGLLCVNRIEKWETLLYCFWSTAPKPRETWRKSLLPLFRWISTGDVSYQVEVYLHARSPLIIHKAGRVPDYIHFELVSRNRISLRVGGRAGTSASCSAHSATADYRSSR